MDARPIEQLDFAHGVTTWRRGEEGYPARLETPDTVFETSTNCEVRLRQDRGDGDWTEARLLRSVEWLRERGIIAAGDWCDLDMPEMGASGLFEVMWIGGCPDLKRDGGRQLTGLFRHSRGRVFELQISGGCAPVGLTALHPVWSVDRCDWISACKMRVCERVRVTGGTGVVLGIAESGEEPVYNVEVDGDHCFRVGEQGLLVHNASVPMGSCCPPGPLAYDPSPVRTQYPASGGAAYKDGVGVEVKGYLTAPRNLGSTFSSTPDWWSALPTPTDFRRGHLLAAVLGGAGGSDYRNLAPIYFQVNNSAMKTCENRIKEAVDCGHCVSVVITAVYTTSQSLYPRIVRMIATSPQGLNINVDIDNVANPGVPIACSPSGPNATKC